jgi:hypothetical protein
VVLIAAVGLGSIGGTQEIGTAGQTIAGIILALVRSEFWCPCQVEEKEDLFKSVENIYKSVDRHRFLASCLFVSASLPFLIRCQL